MEQFFVAKDGKLYREVRGIFRTVYRRVGDDFELPKSRILELRPASSVEPEQQALNASEASSSVSKQVKEEMPQVGLLVQPDAKHAWEKLVLYSDTVQAVKMAVNFIENRQNIEAVFGGEGEAQTVLNFYGPPGTGKTLTAKAVANELQKPLLQADYAQISSKWVGDTAKGISLLFAEAKRLNAIVFLDEADSLVNRRLDNPGDATGQHSNQEKNVLMQEIDRFSGIVILTTNHFQNFDPAMLRRCADHVHFELPDAGMREVLLRQTFNGRVQVNFSKLAGLMEGFAGGDINNVCKNSIKRASLLDKNPTKWRVTDAIVEQEIARVKQAKNLHSGNVRQPMGLRG